MGMERLILLHRMAFPEGFEREVTVFIAHMGDEARKKAFSLAAELREMGVPTETEYGRKSLKSQMKRADKSGARYTLIIGENELARSVLILRDMSTGIEYEVIERNLGVEISKRLGGK